MRLLDFIPHVPSFLLAASAVIGTSNAATLVWEEDFGSIEPATMIGSGNTSLGGANASNGSLTAITSTIGSGSSLQINAATTAGTASGAWIAAGGLGALNATSMSFSVSLSELGSGALGFYMGNGNTVANNFTNYNFNDDHFLWEVSVQGSTGSVRYRLANGTYQDTGFYLQEDVPYEFLIQVNATTAALDGLASNTMSIYVNGSLIGSGLEIRRGTATATGFRIGGRSTTTAGDLIAEIDDLQIWNGIQPIPEPSSALLLPLGASLLFLRRRS